ncbi:MAG: ATP-binding protein, partial [Mariprofundaceae bacterium]|nr:ATP-binding protein [Mariprofundaceae bacterium]
NVASKKHWKLLVGDKKFALQTANQEHLLKLIVLTAIPMLLAFAIFNTLYDFQHLANIQFVMALLFVPMLLSCCFYKVFSIRALEVIILCSGIIVFQSLIIFGGYANCGIYWVAIFPFLAFFTVGLYKGWYWVAAYLSIGVSIGVLSEFGFISIAYKLEELEIFLTSFLFYTLVAGIFAGIRERDHFELNQANKKLAQAKKYISLANKNLKQQVHDRTAELTTESQDHKATNIALENKEQQFQQAQKMESIGILVGGIAHDFNNMLSGINANLFMAKRASKDNPDMQKKMENIEQLVFYASDMIQQLLTFARKDNVELKRFNATPFFVEAYKLAELAIPETIKLEKNFIREPLYIKGNTTQLQQVIMNLINNARDALLDVTNPTIQVQLEHVPYDDALKSAHPEMTHSDYIRLSISDNGLGIEDSKLKHVFEPFFTTKDVGKGTGLGLAMCYGAIQSHEGFMDVQSSLGKGTRFSIYLPVQQKQNSNANQQKTSSPEQGQGELILIVDDDEALRQSNAEVLEVLGYKTLQASNGLEAIQAFEKYQADIRLVFMDIMMPVMGGAEAGNHIHNIQGDMPILFTTGYDKDKALDGRHSLPIGHHTLSKPFTIEQLAEAIQQQINPSI